MKIDNPVGDALIRMVGDDPTEVEWSVNDEDIVLVDRTSIVFIPAGSWVSASGPGSGALDIGIIRDEENHAHPES